MDDILAPVPPCPCCGGRHCSGEGPSTAELVAEQIEQRRREALRELSAEFKAIVRRSYDTGELDQIRGLWREVSV